MDSLFIHNGLITIAAASIITYGFRFGGLLLADRLPASGPLRRFLDALPGTILLSLVVPGAVNTGWPGMIGLLSCLVAYSRTKNLLVTMSCGVLTVWTLRQLA